ncbi:MAG: HD domain-containing protein [Planctomycetes bacterium]|jgi:putative hydrolase of HD superfamily|nr:HD domain-containing protein [Planctomycetota bacterium]
MSRLEKIFNFLHAVEPLKSTLRYITLKSGRTESSAEHSWRLTLLVMLVSEELKLKINTLKAIKIALVHDIAEAITGDIDYVQINNGEYTREEKQKLELKAMKKLQKKLPPDFGQEIFSLWQEYEEKKTKEAKFVKALDKIETTFQLTESGYETWDYSGLIANYSDSSMELCPELLPVLKLVKNKLKAEFKKGRITWHKEYDQVFKNKAIKNN